MTHRAVRVVPALLICTVVEVILASTLPLRSAAETVETGIEVSMLPSLDVLATEDGAKVYLASPGSLVQLRVLVTRSDGATQEVTTDAGTQYVSLSPELISVSQSGEVTFASVQGISNPAAILLITRGELRKGLGFYISADAQ